MPSAWLHATIDLIYFGRSYFDLHKEKDKPHETLGLEHRVENHKYYEQFSKLWTLSNPFPSEVMESIQILSDTVGEDAAEAQQVYCTHDYIDKVWDGLSYAKKRYCDGFCIWLLFNPYVLKNWAGVDVLEGKIHRVVEGQEIWEDCPEVKSKYKSLIRYVEAVICNDRGLQGMLERYGETPT